MDLSALQVSLAPYNKDYAPLMDWCPYVMRGGRPNLRGAVLNTDSIGFRISSDGKTVAKVDDMDANETPKGLILGNSVAFGVNCSSDEAVVSSRLMALSGHPWYNLASRAYTLTQELIAATLHPATHVKWMASISGINELTLVLLGGYSHQGDSYFGAPEFQSRMGARPRKFLGRTILVYPRQASHETSLETAYARMMAATKKRLRGYKLLASAHGARGLLVLQPVLGFSAKELTSEERTLAAASDASEDTRSLVVLNPRTMELWYKRFVKDLAEGCSQLKIEFVNANEFPQLLTPDWLFWDRVHLTDLGHARLAEAIWERLSDS